MRQIGVEQRRVTRDASGNREDLALPASIGISSDGYWCYSFNGLSASGNREDLALPASIGISSNGYWCYSFNGLST